MTALALGGLLQLVGGLLLVCLLVAVPVASARALKEQRNSSEGGARSFWRTFALSLVTTNVALAVGLALPIVLVSYLAFSN